MTDRELIELAAKAAAIDGEWNDDFGKSGMLMLYNPTTYRLGFDPLNDDGDALRLAVKMNLLYGKVFAKSAADNHEGGDDIYAATRRAIVSAAAEIGKGME